MNIQPAKWLGRAGLLGLAVLALAPALRAEDVEEEVSVGGPVFTIGPRAAFVKPKDADEGKWFGGAQARLHLAPFLGIEGSVDYWSHKYDDGAVTFKVYPVQASLLLYLTPGGMASPYILGGAGWYNTRIEGPLDFKDTKQRFGPHAGGGLEVALGRGISLDASYRYIWVDTIATRDLNAVDRDYQESGYTVTAAVNARF